MRLWPKELIHSPSSPDIRIKKTTRLQRKIRRDRMPVRLSGNIVQKTAMVSGGHLKTNPRTACIARQTAGDGMTGAQRQQRGVDEVTMQGRRQKVRVRPRLRGRFWRHCGERTWTVEEMLERF
jgi:hypothetical protein